MKRTSYAGSLTEADLGRSVTVAGWVQARRDMGGVIFVDLRDRSGTLQLVLNAMDLPAVDFSLAEHLKSQSVIAASGILRLRDEETYNPKLATGTIELACQRLELISTAQDLPFNPDDNAVREELRLKYRFLDLRRPSMLANLRYRHQVAQAVRAYLDDDGFIEVETPMLTRSTPEGARDYLVPSRVHPGSFYALPQSPQIFKQLLMVAGVDKYYQVARCFRDEDLRADRQPEFTQVDMELSFVDQEDILQHLERLFAHIFRQVMGLELTLPFPRITWKQAMDQYGTDKPDIRFDLSIVDLTDLAARSGFSVFRQAADSGGVVRAICVPGGAAFTRSTIEELTEKALGYGAKGMAWIAIRPDGSLNSVITKYFAPGEMDALLARMDASPGDFILFCADSLSCVRRTLGGLRLDLGDRLGLRAKDDYRFLFVTDFPQFEYSEQEKRYIAMHHPFTMPYPEDLPYLATDPARVRAQAYDLVLNGIELGSGSIRIHQQAVQRRMFEALGFSRQQIDERFGFMVNAFQYGTPPHGGFAFGLDRLVMLMVGADSLRDVIAFPKAKDASCPLTQAPGPVDPQQLEELQLAAPSPSAPPSSRKTLDDTALQKVARLAQLSLSAQERQRMPGELAAMIAFADELEQLDTTDVPPTAHIAPLTNVFRPDTPAPCTDRALILANARTCSEGYLAVPRVMDEKGDVS